ncbi:MAG: hypothetical protein WDZ48_02855, partial [Pirellulales bacterium]
DHLFRQVQSDPTLLKDDIRPRYLVVTAASLEGTYIVRLFAEFETGLREFWHTVRVKKPPNKVHDLMQSLASRSKVGIDQLQNAHKVREYRNVLVHEREGDVEPMPISIARSHLCTFLSRLR